MMSGRMADTQPIEEPAHDVLAAEAFAVPAPDPDLRQRPVAVPEDPAGIPEPHDVLAAEEFPMPAASSHATGAQSPTRRSLRAGAIAAGTGLLAWRLRRRRR